MAETSPPSIETRQGPAPELDPGSQALADALKVSFGVLKLVMLAVLGIFAVSGFYKVEENQQVLVLRFGEITGSGVDAIKTKGLHWKLPAPIDEVIAIPSSQALQVLTLEDEFWFYRSSKAKAGLEPAARAQGTLQFVRDGYSLTASEGVADLDADLVTQNQETAPTDFNLVHSEWEIQYSISDARRYFENVWDGRDQNHRGLDHLLRAALCDSVITVSASSDIYDMLYGSGRSRFRENVERNFKARLAGLDAGIEIKELILRDMMPPRQVVAAFERAQGARSDLKGEISAAQSDEARIVTQAHADANNRLEQARTYKTKMIEGAKADAEVIKMILGTVRETARQQVDDGAPDAQRRREEIERELLAVIVEERYQKMLADVIGGVHEMFGLPASVGEITKVRVRLTPDPARVTDEINQAFREAGNNPPSR